ncbi:hypothetical protein BG004_006610 [Podila humilis]|nr:hypothetical protein BG004_006610 [Podila humilis]
MDAIVTAAVVIESIWPPPPPGSPEYLQKQKGLPLRTFVQETLKRSRSSYSTLQTALFYLYKIRNKVPDLYLKRREEQALLNQQRQAAIQPASGMVTPPASPHPFHQAANEISSPDYFSLHNGDSRSSSTSPMSSTCSMSSASPQSECSPREPSPPSSTASSPESDSGSPCSVSSVSLPCASTSSSSLSSCSATSSNSQSSRIIYCGRRTFLAALMVASKYLQDRNYSNRAWAKISGLSIKEINANELIFLKIIDYSLFVSHETFMRWTGLLVAHGREATRKFLHSSSTRPVAANHHIQSGSRSKNSRNSDTNSSNSEEHDKTSSTCCHKSAQLVSSSATVSYGHSFWYDSAKVSSLAPLHHQLPPSPSSDPEESIEDAPVGLKQAKVARICHSRATTGVVHMVS